MPTASVGLEEEEEEQVKTHRRRCSSYHHRRSRRLSSSSSLGDDNENKKDRGVPRRNSFSYYRLPEHLLKLSILKLNDSSFEIQVAKSASVLELKLAIEEFFNQSPKQGEGNISWCHVWGHFCLCYKEHKLIDDKASLRNFGIKDGDQLHFIRHLSINYTPPKRHRFEGLGKVSEQHIMSLEEEEKVHHELDEDGNDMDDGECENTGGCPDGSCCSTDEDDDNLHVGHADFRIAHFLRGLLSYTRLRDTGRAKSDGSSQTSRFGSYCQRIRTREPRM